MNKDWCFVNRVSCDLCEKNELAVTTPGQTRDEEALNRLAAARGWLIVDHRNTPPYRSVQAHVCPTCLFQTLIGNQPKIQNGKTGSDGSR